MKRIISLILTLTMMLTFTAVLASAEESITVSVRIEGNDENLFYGDVVLTGDDSFTVEDVLKAADASDDTLTITFDESYYGGYYISAVNGSYAGEFGGWDGWNFIHNAVAPSNGISYEYIAEGSVIVLYYGEYPTQIAYIDGDDSADGEFYIYSDEAIYDDDWNFVGYDKVIITDYTLTWGYGDGETVEIEVGSDGLVVISSEYLEDGTHSVQLSKYSDSGAVCVLRFAPDFEVETIAEDTFIFDISNLIEQISDMIKAIFQTFYDLFLGLFN